MRAFSLRAPLFFAAGIAVALALPAFATMTSSQFRDVPEGAFFSDAVSGLSRIGIIKGYDDGNFGPNDSVTRGQVSVMIQRYDATVIEQLRRQIEELRGKGGLGECGDGNIQNGEECDDGNTYGGDGCSKACLKESFPSEPPVTNSLYGGAKWECYDDTSSRETNACMSSLEWAQIAEKNCANHCGPSGKCGVNNFAVTDSCSGNDKPMGKCHSSDQCQSNEYCTTEKGDCRSICRPGEMCPAVCTGECKPKQTSNTCEPTVCPDGTKVARCNDNGTTINYFADPCSHHKICVPPPCAYPPVGCTYGNPTMRDDCPVDCGKLKCADQ